MSMFKTVAAMLLVAGAASPARDSPVTIGNGSPLKLFSQGGWRNSAGNEIEPLLAKNVVSAVDVSVAGTVVRSISFSNQRCDVTVKFGPSITVTATTDPNGSHLRLRHSGPKPLDQEYQQSYDRKTFESSTSDDVTLVEVQQPGQPPYRLEPSSQPVLVTIHYVQ